MAKLLLKKSYLRNNLKEVNFKDLWGSFGIFTTMRVKGKPPKIFLYNEHINNLIKFTIHTLNVNLHLGMRNIFQLFILSNCRKK